MSRIETVEKRQRRMKRMQRELDLVSHKWSLGIVDPAEALHWVASFPAVWNGVRRLAGCAIGWHVTDVMLAWQIVGFIKKLPDGKERLKAAANDAVAQWQREIDELAPMEATA